MSRELLLGPNALEAVLADGSGLVIEVLVETGSRNPRVQALARQAAAQGLSVQMRTTKALDQLAEGERHQGIAAWYKPPDPLDEADLLVRVQAAGAEALLLILDGVQDPHNLGACLRSAEAAGATAVVVPKDRAVGLTATVRRAAAGAADRVPLVRVTNLARCLRELQQAGVWLVGLAGEAESALWSLDLRGPVGLLLGGEGEGLRRLTREHCDYLARIPMAGRAESLNVSVSAGIALFEARRQRG